MRYRRLGKTDIRVSEIGYGTWGIGGHVKNLLSYGSKDDNDSRAALNSAFYLGVNFYDTSCSYGAGHSEELLGDVFENRRDKVIFATKGGYLNTFNPNGVNQKFDAESIEISIYQSLKRLKTDYIDLYQIHDCPNLSVEQHQDLFELLNDFKQKGIIRAHGFAGKSPNDAIKAVNIFDFDTVQFNFNLTDMRALDNGLIDICKEKNIGLIARTPLVFGFLAGRINEKTNFDLVSGDHRARFTPRQMEKWLKAKTLYQGCFEDIKLATPSQKALVFCLSYPEISVVNCGINLPIHAIDNIKASDVMTLNSSQKALAKSVYDKFYRDEKIETI